MKADHLEFAERCLIIIYIILIICVQQGAVKIIQKIECPVTETRRSSRSSLQHRKAVLKYIIVFHPSILFRVGEVSILSQGQHREKEQPRTVTPLFSLQ